MRVLWGTSSMLESCCDKDNCLQAASACKLYKMQTEAARRPTSHAHPVCLPDHPLAPCTPTRLVGVVQRLAGHHGRATAMHLERTHSGNDDHAVGAQAAVG